MIWVLWFYMSCTGGGCTSIVKNEFPTEEACQRALGNAKITRDVSAAFCAPRGAK